MSAPEKLTAEQLSELRMWSVDARNASLLELIRKKMLAVLLDEHAAQAAEIKRLKVHALNDSNEISELRSEIKHIRRELDEALGRWT